MTRPDRWRVRVAGRGPLTQLRSVEGQGGSKEALVRAPILQEHRPGADRPPAGGRRLLSGSHGGPTSVNPGAR